MDSRIHDKTSPALAKSYTEKYYGKDMGLKKRDDALGMSNLAKSKTMQHKGKDDKKNKQARKPKPVEEKVIFWREAEFLEPPKHDESGDRDNDLEENKDAPVNVPENVTESKDIPTHRLNY